MNYTETLDYLYNALPAYQTDGKSAYKENLDNTKALLEGLDNPQKKFKCIHVAGTNGKGSVSHILAAIFRECGYKTGLYTSPHLLDFRERVAINGQMIRVQTVVDFVEENKPALDEIKPSFFEMTVALAFDTFAKEEVDIAIIETGLGGRLDSTNIINPEAAVITNVSLDHANILGDTLEKIAAEKAGIIKENTPTILGDMAPSLLPIFAEIAAEKKSPLTLTSDSVKLVTQKTSTRRNTITYNLNGKYFSVETDLIGHYQGQNIATALCAADIIDKMGTFKLAFKRSLIAIERVKRNTGLRGRWETMYQKPLWICDTGHNEAGIAQLMEQISQMPHRRKFIIYGCVDDKNVDNIFSLFNTEFHYIFTKSENKRALSEEVLLEKGKALRLSCQSKGTVEEAMQIAKKSIKDDEVVIICGSTFVVADALTNFTKIY